MFGWAAAPPDNALRGERGNVLWGRTKMQRRAENPSSLVLCYSHGKGFPFRTLSRR